MAVTVADTAFTIATIRAEESLRPAGERLFDDPYAAAFAAAGAHAREASERFLALPFFRDGIRLRTRFLDDLVREATAGGITQVVMLGVGFDARSMRLDALTSPAVTTYEVDFTHQLDARRAILDAAGLAAHLRARSVACDFADDGFEDILTHGLVAQGFQLSASTLFVWEGVTAYLPRASVERSLALMAHLGGPGTCVGFDFGSFLFYPDDVAEVVRRLGFARFDEQGLDTLWQRYLPGAPHENAWVARIGVAHR